MHFLSIWEDMITHKECVLTSEVWAFLETIVKAQPNKIIILLFLYILMQKCYLIGIGIVTLHTASVTFEGVCPLNVAVVK